MACTTNGRTYESFTAQGRREDEEKTMTAGSSVPDDLDGPFVGLFDPDLDPDRIPGIHFVTSVEEARAILESKVEYELGISGEEFLRRWDSGEYGTSAEVADTPEGWRIRRLVEVIPTFRADNG
jgi:hypothetical protein